MIVALLMVWLAPTVFPEKAGPVQLKVAPAVEELAVSVIFWPVQTGALVVMVTFAGELGLESLKGPTLLDGQPLSATVISV